MNLNKQQIKEIRGLNQSGKKQKEIANMFGVSQGTISYWLSSEEKRKEISRKKIEKFRKKSKAEKRRIYKQKAEYFRNYYKRRYRKDKEFRENEKRRFRERYKDGQKRV